MMIVQWCYHVTVRGRYEDVDSSSVELSGDDVGIRLVYSVGQGRGEGDDDVVVRYGQDGEGEDVRPSYSRTQTRRWR